MFVGRYVAKIGLDGIKAISLKVNVGSENEWNFWVDDGRGWLLGDTWVEFDSNGNIFCEMIISLDDLSNREVNLWKKDFTDTKFKISTIMTTDKNYPPYVDSINYHNQSVFINKNEVYCVLNNQQRYTSTSYNIKYIELYYFNLNTKEIKEIYSKYLGYYTFCNLEAIYLAQNNNDVYIQFNSEIEQTSIEDLAISYFSYQRYNGTWDPIKMDENKHSFNYSSRLFYVNNVYNLVNKYLFSSDFNEETWYTIYFLNVYNRNNYNGNSYENINLLVPHSGRLYNNDKIIYARNLYNKTINGRTTQSTIEIPNNLLNDVLINKQQLFSETNGLIINVSNVIEKNIYETLYVNFINTLQIENDNDENNIVLNPMGASRLNNSISQTIDFDNSKGTKAKINYNDGTYLIQDISSQIEYIEPIGLNSPSALYNIYVYVPTNKNIETIDIISNDEQTIYQSISNLSFENNKYYNITQPVTIYYSL